MGFGGINFSRFPTPVVILYKILSHCCFLAGYDCEGKCKAEILGLQFLPLILKLVVKWKLVNGGFWLQS